jgi:hypothetical protein
MGHHIFSQSILYEGIVIDAETKLPLNNVNVITKARDVGTFSKSEGKFQIFSEQSDTLIFTQIGYVSREIQVNNIKDTIFLSPSYYQLADVQILSGKKRKKIKLGDSTPNKKKLMVGSLQYAHFVDNPFNETGTITQISIPVVQTTYERKFRQNIAVIRPRVYQKNQFSGLPAQDLLRNELIYHLKPNQSHLKVNLRDESIPFLKEGVFVGFDILGYLDENGELINYHVGDRKKLLAIPWSHNTSLPKTYVNNFGKAWRIIRLPDSKTGNLEYLNVSIDVEVEF